MKPDFRVLFFVLLAVAITSGWSSSTTKRRSVPTIGQSYCAGSMPCVLTYHNDNNRDGTNPHEGRFKASTLSVSNHPAPLWMASTDGQIYTQPLYIHQLQVNGTPRNVVYVATENNSVYAFNSDATTSTGFQLAQINLNNASDLGSGSSEIAVPYTDLPGKCTAIQPEVGITGTPVIDITVTPPVIYLVTKHEDVDAVGGKTFRQKLHGLYADTLQEIPGSPVVLDSAFATANAPGFSPLYNLQRAGLTLVNSGSGTSKIWVTWASHCDEAPYYGFAIAFGYNYSTAGFLTTYTVFNTESACTSQDCQSGIWMGGAAPAADSGGSVYLATGNGEDTHQGTGEYSNSTVRLSDLGFQDYYSPPGYDALNKGHSVLACTNPNPPRCPSPCQLDATKQYCQIDLTPDDWDFGAGGVVLLSPTFKLNNPEMMAAGKNGMIYVLFSASMGGTDANAGNEAEYACATASIPTSGSAVQCFLGFHESAITADRGSRGAPAFLAGGSDNFLYVAGIADILKAYKFVNSKGVGLFTTGPSTAVSPHTFLNPGAAPSVTWNSSKSTNITDAIVWGLDTSGFGTFTRPALAAELFAYRAIPTGSGTGSLGSELWDTTAYNHSVPGNPGAVKFVVPTIVDGKIFVAGGAQYYTPGSANCPTPTLTVQPTACGALTMYH